MMITPLRFGEAYEVVFRKRGATVTHATLPEGYGHDNPLHSIQGYLEANQIDAITVCGQHEKDWGDLTSTPRWLLITNGPNENTLDAYTEIQTQVAEKYATIEESQPEPHDFSGLKQEHFERLKQLGLFSEQLPVVTFNYDLQPVPVIPGLETVQQTLKNTPAQACRPKPPPTHQLVWTNRDEFLEAIEADKIARFDITA